MNKQILKLITLNIWGGHVERPLLDFIKSNQGIDIFCLQEVYHQAREKITDEERYINLNVFSDIQNLLPQHRGYFRPVVNNIYGLGMFINNNILVKDEGKKEIYTNNSYSGIGPTHSRIMQWVQCQLNNNYYTIMNVHGLWNGMGKTDSSDRIEQSIKIKKFVDSTTTSKILCGDFNLRPDTESIKILERGMKNHIKIANIKSTRTSFYPKKELFADYIFTSPDVVVKDFKVLKDEVSDHAPLQIEFLV